MQQRTWAGFEPRTLWLHDTCLGSLSQQNTKLITFIMRFTHLCSVMYRCSRREGRMVAALRQLVPLPRVIANEFEIESPTGQYQGCVGGKGILNLNIRFRNVIRLRNMIQSSYSFMFLESYLDNCVILLCEIPPWSSIVIPYSDNLPFLIWDWRFSWRINRGGIAFSPLDLI